MRTSLIVTVIITIVLTIFTSIEDCYNESVSDEDRRLASLSNGSNPGDVTATIDSILNHPLSAARRRRLQALRAYTRYREGYDDTIAPGLDSIALACLRSGGDDELPFLIRGLFGYGVTRLNADKFQEALNALNESADRALYEARDTFIASRALRLKGKVYSRTFVHHLALKTFTKARQLYRESGQENSVVLMSLYMSNNLTMLGRYEEAIRILDSISENHPNDIHFFRDYDIPGYYIFPKLLNHQYDEVIYYSHRALTSYECYTDDSIFIYGNMVKAFLRMKRNDSALYYYEILNRMRPQNSRRYGKSYIGIANIDIELNESIKNYSNINDYIYQSTLDYDTLLNMTRGGVNNLLPIYPPRKIKQQISYEKFHHLIATIILLTLIFAIFYRKAIIKVAKSQPSEPINPLSAEISRFNRLLTILDTNSKEFNPALIAEFKSILSHMRADSFDEELLSSVYILEPELKNYPNIINAVLSPQEKKMLFLSIAGYNMVSIIKILDISRSTAYRRRQSIVDKLCVNSSPFISHLVSKYLNSKRK